MLIYGTGGSITETAVPEWSDADFTYELLCMKAVTELRRFRGYEENVAFFTFGSDYGQYLYCSTEVDYLSFKANGGTLNLKCYASESSPVEDTYLSYLDDVYLYTGYPTFAYTYAFSDYIYNYYDKTASNNQMLIFDYSNIKENIYNDDYRQEWPVMYNRADNRGYYTIGLKLDGSASTFNVSYGSPLSEIYNQGFASGYSNGYTRGYTDYNGTGHNYSPTGNVTPTAFTYIGNAFSAVSNIMSIEILPNITLGLCFSIPMVLVLIMTIFKLVKK
jgi:hypothetical protein